MIPRLTDPSRIPFDLKKNPKDLTVPEWELIIEEFKRWPFKPEVLICSVILCHKSIIVNPLLLRSSELTLFMKSITTIGKS